MNNPQSDLLKGKTCEDFRRLNNGLINKFEIDIAKVARVEIETAKGSELISLKRIFDESKVPPLGNISLVVTLKIDGRHLPCPSIALRELIRSLQTCGEYEIFTCGCGCAACAGICRDVVVVHDGDLTVWKAYGLKRKRVFVFNRDQYRTEVLTKSRQFMDDYKRLPDARSPHVYFDDINDVEKALLDLNRNNPGI